jgi:aspartate-semialdehyde dehydrogenase
MNRKPHVAVVGATGAVGIEMIKTLEKRNFPVGKLTLLASARSVGKKLKFRGEDTTVTELTKDSFKGIDRALQRGRQHFEGVRPDCGAGRLRGGG